MITCYNEYCLSVFCFLRRVYKTIDNLNDLQVVESPNSCASICIYHWNSSYDDVSKINIFSIKIFRFKINHFFN